MTAMAAVALGLLGMGLMVGLEYVAAARAPQPVPVRVRVRTDA